MTPAASQAWSRSGGLTQLSLGLEGTKHMGYDAELVELERGA